MSTFLTATDIKQFPDRIQNDFDRDVEAVNLSFDGDLLRFEIFFESDEYDKWSVTSSTASSLSNAISEFYQDKLEAHSEESEEE